MTDAAPPLLVADDLVKRYDVAGGMFSADRRVVHAVSGVSFVLNRGETLGLVGESGSGKSTIGKMIVRLEQPTSGRVLIDGMDIAGMDERALRPHRRRIQMIFQDPYASLDPRMTAGDIIAEPLVIQGIGDRRSRERRVAELLDRVGLPAAARGRLPNEFSGGQRQRIGIARAIALNPDIVVADEAVSALDVSVQAQVVNLLEDLQAELGVSYIFIAHDLAVVRHIATRVAVLYLGRIMEIADRDTLYARPLHPYTRALMDAAPVPDPAVEARRAVAPLEGEIPSPFSPPSGCVFSTRCRHAEDACRSGVPRLRELGPGHAVACIKAQADGGYGLPVA